VLLLLTQIDEEITKVSANSAHYGACTYETIVQHGSNIEVVISPAKSLFPLRNQVLQDSVIVLLK
jgi:hypothetical protein